MRIVIASLALILTGALFAQNGGQPQNTKDIMVKLAIPASNALFDAATVEKPTAAQWAEWRKQAVILQDAAKLLQAPGVMASGKTTKPNEAKAGGPNPAAWNKASVAMGDAGKFAVAAIDKKDVDGLAFDAADKILMSCSGCHDQYMIK
jgi:hypothetical protein